MIEVVSDKEKDDGFLMINNPTVRTSQAKSQGRRETEGRTPRSTPDFDVEMATTTMKSRGVGGERGPGAKDMGSDGFRIHRIDEATHNKNKDAEAEL